MARRLYIRKFLNRPGHHAGAHVLIEVDSQADAVDVTFRITDCYDGISLDFDMETAAERRNSLHKARVLREAVGRLEAVLEAELAARGKAQRRAS